MWYQKQYLKNFKKGKMVILFSFLSLRQGGFWYRYYKVDYCMIYMSIKDGKKHIYFWYEFFIFCESVFYFCGEANRYFILRQKILQRIEGTCMTNMKNSVEHFLKHSSFEDMLILLFASSHISYVEELKKVT